VVPLKIQGSIVGALVILKMLDHKPILSEDDKELLQLIASHAATALFAARTYTKANRKMRTLEALVRLIRGDEQNTQLAREERIA
jgi:GAF domain-containing protein